MIIKKIDAMKPDQDATWRFSGFAGGKTLGFSVKTPGTLEFIYKRHLPLIEKYYNVKVLNFTGI